MSIESINTKNVYFYMYSTNTQRLKQSYIFLYFAKKWELGTVIDWNVQIYMDII